MTCASGRLVVDGEGGVLVFEEAFRDREAEPGPAVGAAGCRGSADAGFEDVWEEVGVDSGSVVLDGDLDGRLVRGGPAEVDRGARGAVAERVVEDVGESAFEAVAVDDDAERLVAVEVERVVSEAGRVLEAGRDLLEQVGDRRRLRAGAPVGRSRRGCRRRGCRSVVRARLLSLRPARGGRPGCRAGSRSPAGARAARRAACAGRGRRW